MSGPVEVPAPVFDALEAVANQFGGVGGFHSYLDPEPGGEMTVPMCLLGLARYADNMKAGRAPADMDCDGPIRGAAGVFWGVVRNDNLLMDWIEEDYSTRTRASRMPWAEYVERAGFVRVETPPCVQCGGLTARNRAGDMTCASPACFAFGL